MTIRYGFYTLYHDKEYRITRRDRYAKLISHDIEELKNDYKKEYLKRKDNLEKIEGIKENLFSDDEFVFRLEDGTVTEASRIIEKIHNTSVTQTFDEKGNLLTIKR